MKKILLLLLTIFLLTSCVVNSNIDLTNKNFEGEIAATEFFSLLLEDLSSFTRSDDNTSLLNQSLSEFVTNLTKTQNVYNVDLTKEEDKEYYNLSFSYSDLNQFLSNLSSNTNQSILKINDHSIILNINMDNYSQLEEMIPFLKQEDIAVYCARYNQDYSEEEYLTMMNFIAGEQAEEGIRSSFIKLNLNLPTPISDTNGIIIDENTVSFEFKMIDFLLLHSPISFYCYF